MQEAWGEEGVCEGSRATLKAGTTTSVRFGQRGLVRLKPSTGSRKRKAAKGSRKREAGSGKRSGLRPNVADSLQPSGMRLSRIRLRHFPAIGNRSCSASAIDIAIAVAIAVVSHSHSHPVYEYSQGSTDC